MRGGETHKVVVLTAKEKAKLMSDDRPSDDSYIVFVDSEEDLKKWLEDPDATPLAQVVSNFSVHITKHGAQGDFHKPSKGTLSDAFPSMSEDEIIKLVLKNGNCQPWKTPTRDSSTNDSKGSQVSHR